MPLVKVKSKTSKVFQRMFQLNESVSPKAGCGDRLYEAGESRRNLKEILEFSYFTKIVCNRLNIVLFKWLSPYSRMS